MNGEAVVLAGSSLLKTVNCVWLDVLVLLVRQRFLVTPRQRSSHTTHLSLLQVSVNGTRLLIYKLRSFETILSHANIALHFVILRHVCASVVAAHQGITLNRTWLSLHLAILVLPLLFLYLQTLLRNRVLRGLRFVRITAFVTWVRLSLYSFI